MPTVPTRKANTTKIENAAADSGAMGVDIGVGSGLIDTLHLDNDRNKMNKCHQQKDCKGAYSFKTEPTILKNRRCFQKGLIEK